MPAEDFPKAENADASADLPSEGGEAERERVEDLPSREYPVPIEDVGPPASDARAPEPIASGKLAAAAIACKTENRLSTAW